MIDFTGFQQSGKSDFEEDVGEVTWMEIIAPEDILIRYFEGPPAEIGEAVELVCVARERGKMKFQMRVVRRHQ